MNILGGTDHRNRPASMGLKPAMQSARTAGRANLKQPDIYMNAEPRLGRQRPRAGLIGLAYLEATIHEDCFSKRLLVDPYRTFLLPGNAYHLPQHIRLGLRLQNEAADLDLGLGRMSDLLATLEPRYV